jgi:hypothetical protein
MNLLFVFADNPNAISGSSEFRCKIPWRAVNLHTSHHADIAPFVNHDMVRAKTEAADAILFERNYFGENLDLLKELRERYPQKAFIATFDDGYPYCTPDMDIYRFWIQRSISMTDGSTRQTGYDPVKQFKEAIPLFDAVFVPNHELVRDFQATTPAYFVNSFLETEPFLKAQRTREADGKIVIGVGAGASHYRSFLKSGVLEALNRILREYKQVEFWIRGAPVIIEEVRRRLPADKVIWQIKGIKAGMWEEVLVNFDIGLAILDPGGKFDARRSPIKIFEHMLARVPVIASKSPTYKDYSPYGLFCENQIEWYRAFKQVIEHYAEHSAAYVQKAYDFACSIDIKYHVQEEYIERIEKILAEKNPLPAALNNGEQAAA